MKILWIEDFGAGNQENPEPEGLAKSIFKDLLSNISLIFDEIDDDEEFNSQFSKLVHDNTIHDIDICCHFGEWINKFRENFDYDAILIDINLENGSVKSDIPQDYPEDFHQRAGFYIYNEILRKGFPDSNIAFFTGEEGSFNSFKDSCFTNSMPVPNNLFVKEKAGFEKLREWLSKKADLPFLKLRRGIIDCRSEISSILNELDEDKVKKILIFNDTVREDNNCLDFADIKLYLDILANFFPFSSLVTDTKSKYYGFLMQLSGTWERSKGWLDKRTNDSNKRKKFKFKSKEEYNFKNYCQQQMKLIRNWTAHNQISTDLREKELAFYFLTAMRGLFDLEISRIYRFEKILLSIFKNEKVNVVHDKGILGKLAYSYYEVRNLYNEKASPSHIEFIDVLKDVWKQDKFINSSDIDLSKKLIYQLFWHSLYPAKFDLNSPDGNHESVQMFINFDINKIPSGIIDNIAKSIYSISF